LEKLTDVSEVLTASIIRAHNKMDGKIEAGWTWLRGRPLYEGWENRGEDKESKEPV
jgi:hypothetical protein